MLEHDIKRYSFPHDEIVTATRELGQNWQKITKENPILVGILKGSVPFMAELD